VTGFPSKTGTGQGYDHRLSINSGFSGKTNETNGVCVVKHLESTRTRWATSTGRRAQETRFLGKVSCHDLSVGSVFLFFNYPGPADLAGPGVCVMDFIMTR
jgi:hypothetical protein